LLWFSGLSGYLAKRYHAGRLNNKMGEAATITIVHITDFRVNSIGKYNSMAAQALPNLQQKSRSTILLVDDTNTSMGRIQMGCPNCQLDHAQYRNHIQL
jgi:hypothetical protein